MKLEELKKGMKVIPFKMVYQANCNEKRFSEWIKKKSSTFFSVQSMIDFGYAVVKYVDKKRKRVLLTHEKHLDVWAENEGGNWYTLDEFRTYEKKEDKQYLLDI